MLTVPIKLNIVPVNAIGINVFVNPMNALHAGNRLHTAEGSVQRIAGGGTGTEKKAKDTKNENGDMPTKRKLYSNTLAGNASIAALKIGACLKLTTLTHQKNYVQRIDNILPPYAFRCGKKRKIIYKFFVQIATGLKPMLNHGLGDIACRRIEEAYKQPDMFIQQTVAKPEQVGLEI